MAQNDDPVGNNWETVANLLLCIGHLARDNARPVDIDFGAWEQSWVRLRDARPPRTWEQPQTARMTPSLAADSWIGGWDGAGDTVLMHASAREFSVWPSGHEWLDSLAQSVAQLSEASQHAVAREAAERLVAGATEKFGRTDPKSLAARHSLAFWTGQSGRIRRALELTSQLRVDCREHLGAHHILTRLAVLREAWWTGHLGQWRPANRLYAEAVRAEAARPDRDQSVWLLARWGMARTGGRSGNLTHAHTELEELLPSVIEAFGQDHPMTLDASAAHARAVGQAGYPDTAHALLKELLDRTDTALRPDHPTAFRIRIAFASSALHCGAVDQALSLASTVRTQCATVLGPDHRISINAAETEALCHFERADNDAALASFHDTLERRVRCLGPRHPHTLQTESNYLVVQSAVEGPTESTVDRFSHLYAESAGLLGSGHPDTLRIRVNLIIALLSVRGPAEAHDHCLDTVDLLHQVLGAGHPDSAAAGALLESIELKLEDTRELREPPPYYRFSGGGNDEGMSDRDLKCNVVPVSWPSAAQADVSDPAGREGRDDGPASSGMDGFAILRTVASMPVSTWSYRGEEHVRHLGPMAQDWHAELGIGPDDRSIHLVDANGVSLVAVQALFRLVEGLTAEVRELRERLDSTGSSNPPRPMH
ncbi:hypothetical protein ABZX40_20895 [Streptomyces sp. NPDC004610]|uniref:hypothetical protein n=1 Tax=unclassified Streptomyces TaxID=2593676 RepID=UPI0033B5E5DA